MLSAYSGVLANPAIRRIFAASIVARLPVAFGSLAIVLLVRDVTGSFTAAGIAAGATLVFAGAASPFVGRAVDRLGQRPLLVPLGIANGVAYAILAIAGIAEAPAVVLVVLSAVAGLTMPPISACTRALLSHELPDAHRDSGYALEAILQELTFIGGPLIVAVAVAVSGPAAAVFTGAFLSLAGTLWFATGHASRSWRAPVVTRPLGGAIASPAVQTMLAYGLFAGAAFGAMEVGTTAFTRAEAVPNRVGPLLAIWALGSLIGGVVYGHRTWDAGLRERLMTVTAVMVFAFAANAVAPTVTVMYASIFLCGLPIAPMAACLYQLTGDLAPPGMLTESFTWLGAAFPGGSALGAAIAGVAADHLGPRHGLGLAALTPAVALLVLATRHGTLAPADAGRTGQAVETGVEVGGGGPDVR